MCFLLNLSASSSIIEKLIIDGSIYTEDMLSKHMIIIGADEIKNSKVKSMSDLFSFLPGVDVNRRGQGSTSYDLVMRGSNFEQILIMVNGIPVNNLQTGHFNTDLPFTPEDIERVEISRGGNSVFYGITGFAGIINIILKKRSDIKLNIFAGEKSFSEIGVSAGKNLKHFNFGISARRSSSSGYYNGQEFDNISFRSNMSFNSKVITGSVETGYLKKDFGAKDFYAPFPSLEKIESGLVQFRIVKRGKLSHKLSFSHNLHNDNFILDRYNTGYFNSTSKTTQNYLKFHSDYNKKNVLLSGGIDLNLMKMDSTTMGLHTQKRGGIYFALGLKEDRWGFDLGLRMDSGLDRKSQVTFYTGIYKVFSNKYTLRGNIGRAVRYPTFTELFYNSPSNIGDTELLMEKSENLEISFSYPHKNFNMDLSVFYRKQDQMIDWIRNADEVTWRAVNTERNDVSGFEILINYNSEDFRVLSSFERVFILGYESGYQSKYGFRFPDIKWSANFQYNVSSKIDLVFNYIYKQIFETKEHANLFNVSIGWKSKIFGISMHIDNIFNSIIEEIPGIKIPGRWIWFSLNFGT